MIYLILSISLVANIIFFWYIRKLVQKLNYGVSNVDQLQELLDEYCKSLESMLEMEVYYGDDTMNAAVKNTKMVIELCKGYKKTIMTRDDMSQQNDTEETR